MRIFKKLFLHSFKHYMIAAGAFVSLVMICMWIDKFNTSQFPAAFASSGLVLTFVGLLLMLSYLGAFDTLGYAFTTFRSRNRRPYKDLVEYTVYDYDGLDYVAKTEFVSKEEWSIGYLLNHFLN